MPSSGDLKFYFPDNVLEDIQEYIDKQMQEESEQYREMRENGWENRSFEVDGVSVKVEFYNNE